MALDVNLAKGWNGAGSNFTAIGADLDMIAQIAEIPLSELKFKQPLRYRPVFGVRTKNQFG